MIQNRFNESSNKCIKLGFQRNMNPAKVLLEMEEAISKSKLPKEEKNKVCLNFYKTSRSR